MSLPSILDYLPRETALRLVKTAETEKTAAVGKAIKVVAKSLTGFGVGTAAGLGTGMIVDHVYHATTGERLPKELLLPAASILGAGMGLAYSMYKSKELEELQSAIKAKRNDTPRRVPSQ